MKGSRSDSGSRCTCSAVPIFFRKRKCEQIIRGKFVTLCGISSSRAVAANCSGQAYNASGNARTGCKCNCTDQWGGPNCSYCPPIYDRAAGCNACAPGYETYPRCARNCTIAANCSGQATNVSGDDFIAFSTWKWMDLHSKSGAPVYQYHFEQIPKYKPGYKIDTLPAEEAGARLAGELEYVFGTLKLAQPESPWSDEDLKLSDAIGTYWTNFIKTGNPNKPVNGLPDWPQYKNSSQVTAAYWIMHLSGHNLGAAPDTVRLRYLFLDSHATLTGAK